MKKFFKNNFKILIILALATVLRFWDLGSMPPHLRNDEASLGYNAYSILLTGKDEHGDFLPIFFKSFGDWKPGFYVYLTVPFIAIFGLNELSVRLPAAISGVISVWLIHRIVIYIFASRKLALITALVFSISPLFVVFSRGAWEVNVSLVLTLAAILFFLMAMKVKSKFLLLSVFFFGLTFFTSHTAKLSSPLIFSILLIAYYKQFKKIGIKIVLVSFLIGLIFTIPLALSFIQGKAARITTLSIFSYQLDAKSTFQSIAFRWFSLYSGSTLFIKGDTNPQHTAPNSGPLLLIDSVFLIAGIIRLIRSGGYQQNIFIWSSILLLSLPSALTIEKANFERVLPMFIPLSIIIAMGIKSVLDSSGKFILFIFIFFYALNFIYFLDQYFVHAAKKNDAWQYGYKQIFEKVGPLQQNYQKIIVQQSLEHPYIFLLFYQKYDPAKYQKIVRQVYIPKQRGKGYGAC